MALQRKYAKKEDIPATLVAAYIEGENGEWVLDIDVPDVENLNRAIAAERKRASDAEKEVKGVREQLADATRKLEAKDASGQQTEEKIAAMLAKWEKDKNEAVAAAVAEKDAELAKLTERVTKYDLDDNLAAAFRAAGGRADRQARALALAKMEGWRLVDGKPVKYDANGQAETVTPEDFFGKVFKKDVPEFFEGSKADGGAGPKPGTTGGAGGANAKPPQQWTSEERRAYIEANGLDAFSALLNEQLVAAVTTKPAT